MGEIPNQKVIIDQVILEAVLGRLGLDENPGAGVEGIQNVYRSWCAAVPFDNVRKMIALRTGESLPGHTAGDFFENWLRDGVGGTCWPTSNALYALSIALGFDSRRIAASMRDIGIINHGSIKVRIDGRDWLIDSSILCNTPLPLGEEVFATGDPVFEVEVERVDGTHVVWTHTPPHTEFMPCRLILDPAGAEVYRERYEASREVSPFNQRLYARRNRPGRMVVLLGNTLFIKTARGVESEELTREGVCEALRDLIGLSGELVKRWVDAGCLESSFEPPSGPKPPPFEGKPPRQRISSSPEV